MNFRHKLFPNSLHMWKLGLGAPKSSCSQLALASLSDCFTTVRDRDVYCILVRLPC